MIAVAALVCALVAVAEATYLIVAMNRLADRSLAAMTRLEARVDRLGGARP